MMWIVISIRFRFATGREMLRSDRRGGANILVCLAVANKNVYPTSVVHLPSSILRHWLAPSRWLRGAATLCVMLLPIMLSLCLYVYLRQSSKESLQQALEQVDRADPSWHLEDIEARRPIIPDKENGALRAMEAQK